MARGAVLPHRQRSLAASTRGVRPLSPARKGNRDEQLADRRLRPPVGLPLGGTGQPGRFGGLAMLPAVRRAGRVRPHSRLRWRPLRYQAVGRGDRGHGLGAGSPGVLLRRLACTDGEMEVEVTYAPRPEYGLIHPILEAVPGGLAARGGADRLLLSAPIDFRVDGATASARPRLEAGQTAGFALHHGRLWEPALTAWDQDQIAARLHDTLEAWRSWSAIHQTYEGPWKELVHHSGRVLQALTFQPTGAIVAAPTTSLPETVGGERNWDYRSTWVRDACLTME